MALSPTAIRTSSAAVLQARLPEIPAELKAAKNYSAWARLKAEQEDINARLAELASQGEPSPEKK